MKALRTVARWLATPPPLPVTLRELIALRPERFYPQTWYHGEAFLSRRGDPHARTPTGVLPHGATLHALVPHAPAVDLVTAYLRDPHAACWTRYLWTADEDHKGQAVYVGGVSADNGFRLEIHRHLTLTDQWGTPTWD